MLKLIPSLFISLDPAASYISLIDGVKGGDKMCRMAA